MITLLTAALFYLVGGVVAGRNDDLPIERACHAATAGGALWIFTTWVLALTHALTNTGLGVRLIVLLGTLAILVWKGKLTLRTPRPATILLAALLVPWIGFLLWRGAIIPPVSHDALSYHLPKATLFAAAGGYEYFSFLIPVVRTLPVNYELLLAEVIVWTGSDNLTEWLSIVFYLFFVMATGALTERWWDYSRWAAPTLMLCTASVPVLLLHSGADKNDMMVAAFMVAGLVAAGRWISTGEIRALLLTIVAFGCAVGTKPQAGLLALLLTPFLSVRLIRERGRITMPRVVALIVFAVVAFFSLGGVAYASNFAHQRASIEREKKTIQYGDWSNLWQGPYVLVAAPFAGDELALRVPWRTRPWFWRRYEIYFSHLGVVWALAAIASPFASIWSRRLSPQNWRERLAITIAALCTLAIMLPVRFTPHGLYAISLPRYALFIVPVVFAWTIGPLIIRLERRSVGATIGVVAVVSLIFIASAVECALGDVFAPLSYVRWARDHPGTRVVAFDPNRAASIIDRAAGPRDTVAIDAGYGTWIQPAFGRDLKRPVEFIPQEPGPPQISEKVKWVGVDRAFTTVWGHPQFRDLSEATTYLLRGQPTREELRVIEYLQKDPRFELVFYNRKMVQAVFRRVH